MIISVIIGVFKPDVDCGFPEGISHGSYKLQGNNTRHGAVAAYYCKENWKISSHRSRRFCQENGTWSGEVPQCEGIC